MANTNVLHPDTLLDFNTAHVMHIIMTQLSMKASMKHWGERGTRAVSKELQQLHHRDTFQPVDLKMMMSEDFQEVLKSHLFLKQKHNDSIKGRMVIDGSKQQTSIMKEDATSPTVALKLVLLTAMIDAAEGWDVTTIDIPNTFVQTRLDDNSDKVLMRLCAKEMANANVQHPDAHLDFNAAHVMHIVMTQLSMKAGMKHWGE